MEFQSLITVYTVQDEDWGLSIFFKMYGMIINSVQKQNVYLFFKKDV